MKNMVEQRDKLERLRVSEVKELVEAYPEHPATPILKRAVAGLKDKTRVHISTAVVESIKAGCHVARQVEEGYDEDEDADFEIHKTVVGRPLGQPAEEPAPPAPSLEETPSLTPEEYDR